LYKFYFPVSAKRRMNDKERRYFKDKINIIFLIK